jgi:methyl-accepting chemotaxis protein
MHNVTAMRNVIRVGIGRFLRIVANVVIVVVVVSVGRAIVAAISAIAAVAERQFAVQSLHARRDWAEILQIPQILQLQIGEMLQKLKKLQLQLRDSCNNGMRDSRSIGCEGAVRRRTLQ